MIGRGVFSKKQIHVTSKNEMDKEMKRIQELFKKKEGEETWEQFDQALKNIKVWATVDKIYQYSGFVDHIKLLKQPIISSLTSERTRLSGTASDLLQSLSLAMRRKYEIIHELFMPTLIQLFSRSNKVHVRNTLSCFKAIVENSKVPRTTHRLCMILKQTNNNSGNNNSSNNISKATRYHVTECLNTVIQVNATSDILHYVDDIEAAIKSTAMDPAPEVRSSIRMCYKLYCEKVPERVTKFKETMSTDVLRYLQVSTGNRGSGSTSIMKNRSTASIKNNITTTTSKLQRTASSKPPSTLSSPLSTRRSIPLTSRSSSTSSTSTSTSTSTTYRHQSSVKSTKIPTTSSSSYLSATASSTAKIASNDSSLTTIQKKRPINLPSKYIGSSGASLKLEPGFRLRAPSLIRGKPVLRQRVLSSPKKEHQEDQQQQQQPPNNDHDKSLSAGLKRTLPDPYLQEEDTNQKKIKTQE